MKIAASSYSFSQLIKQGKMTQLDCIAKAKEMGFDAIELVEIQNFAGGDLMHYAQKLGKEAEKQQMPVSNFTFGADLLHGCDGNLKKEIDRVKEMIDAAEITGAKSIRHDVVYQLGEYRSFGQILPQLSEACCEITEYAAQKGIRTMVENHGYICQDSLRMEQLFRAVNHPNFGLLIDMGNFLCADEPPEIAVSRLASCAFYVHAKDFIIKPAEGSDPGEGFIRSRGGNYLRGTIVGHGNVPVRQCLRILNQARYAGSIAIEFEGIEPAEEALSIGLKNLKKYIAQETK